MLVNCMAFQTTGISLLQKFKSNSAVLLSDSHSVTLPTTGHKNKQINEHPWANGHFSVVTGHKQPYLSKNLKKKLSASSIPVPLVLICLHVCFCSLSQQKQMASSLSWIQCWSCVGWNLMPTCAPRHAFHTTHGSLLSVCLHCRAKLSPLTPMNH